MKLQTLVETLNLRTLTPGCDLSVEITGGYASDLLSDVLAHGPAGGVLVTVQVHMNVVAVALHAGMRAVIFALDREPEPAVRAKAAAEEIALFVTPAPAFDVVGQLYQLGVRGHGA